uniref:Protein fantomlike [Strongylocentrotus purpuratus] n=1 Tax=Lepeophtheirus salmonis TaxID=72036 RepID=A0A0K2T4J1_LEPSM
MLEETIMTLKERISIFEQEVDLVKEQSKIKESNLEEEIDHLKSEMSEGHRDKVNENVGIMKIQREIKTRNTQIKGYETQIQALEVELDQMKASSEKNRREAVDLSAQLQEEQKKALSSNNEKSNSVILKQTIKESEEKINDLKKENLILREHNERLLNSAFDLERERQYQATENSLKLKIAQLESTMKNDLTDKKGLSDALEKQREAYSKLEIEFEDVRSKFYKLKQLNEDNDEGSKESSFQGSPFDPREIEEALFYLRQKKDQTLMGYPSFMTEIDNKKDFNIAELKKEISEIQVQYVDTVNELDKTRELLRIQNNINTEQKKEIESLHKRITGVKSEYLSQISEFKKLLDMRANRILKLENQIRENAYVSVRSNHRQKSGAQCSSFMSSNEVSLHTPSGQSLFEIHISKVSLIPNAVTAINDEHLNIFATWCFYDNEMQYSPVIQGPEASLDCSSYYKVKLKDEFLEYLKEGYMVVEIHLATDDESDKENSCRTIASARINLSQVLEYPSNKLHGSVMVYSTSGVRETSNILGTLDFWFKLHTAATNRIVQWLECKNEIERNMRISESNMRKSNENILKEVDLYSGESADIGDSSIYVRARPPMSLPDEPKPAPRVSKTIQKSPENQQIHQPSPRKRRNNIPKSPKTPNPNPIPRHCSKIAQKEIPKKDETNFLDNIPSSPPPNPKSSPSTDSSSGESETDTSFELKQSSNIDEPPKEPIQLISENTELESKDVFSVDDEMVDLHEQKESKEMEEEENESNDDIEDESTSYESEYSESIDSSLISNDETNKEILQKEVTISSQETIINDSDKSAGKEDQKKEEKATEVEVVEDGDGHKKKKKGIFATLFGRKKSKNENSKDNNSDTKKKEDDSKKKIKKLEEDSLEEEDEDSQSDS